MAHSPDVKFSFKNLQPINYLRTFNKMIDYQSRNSEGDLKKSQLKIVSLSKFPTPKDYENMQGIFENINKKKIENDMNKYNKELEEEEKFMKKHNQFMRKVLVKFIEHNQSRQRTYEKQKAFYKQDFQLKNHLRSNSEPKLDRVKKEIKEKDKTIDHETEGGKATLGSEPSLQENREEKSQDVLPKLQPRKKKEKVTLRKQKQIEDYVIKRKLTNPEVATSRSPLSPFQESQQNLDFKSEIVNLQRKQAKIQSNFSDRIQKEISDFGRKMSIQVHAINYYSFWKQPNADAAHQQKQKKAKKLKQQAMENHERVDYSIKFRNYQST